ncbi:acyl-CoA dehydrogenase [Pseudomonas sp. BAY1663]|nr:acyl-CoA dehydrogenase [Pseudomonas sp. BAY1663]
MTLLWLLVLLLGIAVIAHLRVSPIPALAIVATYLILMSAAEEPPGWLMLVLWLVLIAVAVPLLADGLRRKYFSGPMFDWFKKVLPPISATERDAIEAGSVWWDGELFSGRPHWDTLLDYPPARLSDEEQAFLDGPTETLCAMVSEWDIAQRLDLPPAAWDYIKAEGFFA